MTQERDRERGLTRKFIRRKNFVCFPQILSIAMNKEKDTIDRWNYQRYVNLLRVKESCRGFKVLICKASMLNQNGHVYFNIRC